MKTDSHLCELSYVLTCWKSLKIFPTCFTWKRTPTLVNSNVFFSGGQTLSNRSRMLYMNMVSPLCDFLCVISGNWLWLRHVSHEWGLSLVGIIMCSYRGEDRLKSFPHVLHEYGLSPVWIFICFFVGRQFKFLPTCFTFKWSRSCVIFCAGW